MRKEPTGRWRPPSWPTSTRATSASCCALEADLAMLLAEEDVDEIGKALEPGTIAAVLVYENSWAGPFAASIRRSGGQLVANGRVPTQALLAAIDADAQPEMQGA